VIMVLVVFDTKGQDLSVVRFLSPISGCDLDYEKVIVRIINFGSDVLVKNVDISYSVNGQSFVTESVILRLPTNATYTHEFTTGLVNLSEAGDFSFTATVNIAGDTDISNNTYVGYEVNSDALSYGGVIDGTGDFCESITKGVLNLENELGEVKEWQESSDGISWSTINSTSKSLNLSTIIDDQQYRAVVKNGFCEAVTSLPQTITIVQDPVPGFINDESTCFGDDVTMELNNYSGNIQKWQRSPDNGITWVDINNTSNYYTQEKANSTSLYRAVLGGINCNDQYSSSGELVVLSLSEAGIISDDTLICSGTNAVEIGMERITGVIKTWETSNDLGSTWNSLNDFSQSISLSNLNSDIWIRSIVQNQFCMADTSEIMAVVVFQSPTITVDADIYEINEGEDSVVIYASGAHTYLWTPSDFILDETLDTIIVYPPETTTYSVLGTNSNGCSSRDSIVIGVIPKQDQEPDPTEIKFNISNAITANDDGINDTWFVEGIEQFPNSKVFIFNDVGQILYEESNYMNDWKGTYQGQKLPNGTYFYLLSFSGSSKIYRGALTILSN